LGGDQHTERRVESLQEAVDGLQASRERVFKAPPPEWAEGKSLEAPGGLGRTDEKSALLLREILGRSVSNS